MRSMSFSLTEQQFLAGTKDVTRRKGWANLKPGTRLKAVRKAMGLRKGEQQVVLGIIEVVDVRLEPLWRISPRDVQREGFPEFTRTEFIGMFCDHMGGDKEQIVTRIEFKKVEDAK